MNFRKELENSNSIAEVCYLAEQAVLETVGLLNKEVVVQFEELKGMPSVGGFYSPYLNIIVVNKHPIKKLLEANIEVLKEYLFYVLLHECIHSIGIVDEKKTRKLTTLISCRLFGKEHAVTRLCTEELMPFNKPIRNIPLKRIIREEIKIFYFQQWPDFLDL
ncbi:MAG: hypothetical protein V1837_05180 [Candidatus Woesearchaeota archaeon]